MPSKNLLAIKPSGACVDILIVTVYCCPIVKLEIFWYTPVGSLEPLPKEFKTKLLETTVGKAEDPTLYLYQVLTVLGGAFVIVST